MSVSERQSDLVTGRADIVSDPTPVDLDGSTGLASTAPADLLAAGLTESLGRLAMLAGTALSAPRASVMFADSYFYYRERTAPRLSTDSRARLNKGCAPMSFGRKTS
jgi:hypothetical protein